MTVQLSVDVRNARVDAIESTVGVSAKLEIRSGAQPASCAAAETGTQIAQLDLPSDWMGAAASGAAAKAGTWSGAATAAGTAGHFRIKDGADTTCHLQGSVTGIGGGGDMELDNVSIADTQPITINTFTITDGNA